MEEAEQRITTTIDIRPVLERKREALFAHASQIQDSWFSKLPTEIARPRSAGRASSGPPTPPARPCRRTTCSPACARDSQRSLGRRSRLACGGGAR